MKIENHNTNDGSKPRKRAVWKHPEARRLERAGGSCSVRLTAAAATPPTQASPPPIRPAHEPAAAATGPSRRGS